MSLTLLPSGGFTIGLKDGTEIKGAFNGASFRKLCLKHNIEFSEAFERLSLEPEIPFLHDLILTAVEGDYDTFNVMDWITELDGLNSEDGRRLIGHCVSGYVSKKKVANE